MDISKIKLGNTTYDVKDSSARSKLSSGEIVHYLTNVSGTAGSTASGSYNRTQWTGTTNDVTSLYSGLAVFIKIPIAGCKYGVTLNVNSLGEHPVVLNVNSTISTLYAVGVILPLVYDADLTATAYVNNVSTTFTGCWKMPHYDTNTDVIVRLYKQITDNSTWNKDYPLVASRTLSSAIAETDGKYANMYGLIGSNSITPTVNPITGAVKVKSLTIDGTLLESKTAEASGTTLSLVTTGEKATWDAKTSNTGTVTSITAGTGLTGGTISTSGTIALATSGVTAGTYKSVTVDTYGRVTAGTNPTDEDTKNTAGTTNNADKKMYIVGAESQGNNPLTYSNSNCYIGTDNCLYSGGSKVLTSYTEQYTGTVTGVTVGTGGSNYTPTNGVVTIPAYPTTLPASDVSAWAKAASKPDYAYSEIGYTIQTTNSAGGAITVDATKPLHEITITAAVSGITFASNSLPEDGHSCHLIITAASDLTVALAHDATMATVSSTAYKSVCPGAEDVSLNIVAGGYVELDLLRIGTKIYVRGV